MAEPTEIIYQRWWSVYGSHPFSGVEDFADEESAVRRAVEMLKAGSPFVNVAYNDRPKFAPEQYVAGS